LLLKHLNLQQEHKSTGYLIPGQAISLTFVM
jgi:hypothetical protein